MLLESKMPRGNAMDTSHAAVFQSCNWRCTGFQMVLASTVGGQSVLGGRKCEAGRRFQEEGRASALLPSGPMGFTIFRPIYVYPDASLVLGLIDYLTLG